MIVRQAGIRRRAYRPVSRSTQQQLARGVVVAVSYADNLLDPRQLVARPRQVLCDVWLATGGRLRGVPVLQRGASVGNASLWVPQPATRNLRTGAPLALANTGPLGPAASGIEDLDGEWVLVGFIDGEATRPIILGAAPHPLGAPQQGALAAMHAADLPAAATGVPQPMGRGPDGNERWLAHQGAEVRIDRVGNLRIDLAGAGVENDGVTPVLLPPGVTPGNVDVNLAAGREVTLRLADVPVLRLRCTATGLEVDVGALPTQHAVLGELLTALFDAHRHYDAWGATGPVVAEDRMAAARGVPGRDPLSDAVRLPGPGGA